MPFCFIFAGSPSENDRPMGFFSQIYSFGALGTETMGILRFSVYRLPCKQQGHQGLGLTYLCLLMEHQALNNWIMEVIID